MPLEEFRKELARTDELKISVKGRRSGKMITLPVWFVHEGNKLYLLAVHGSDTNWYKNVLKNPTIMVSARGKEVTLDAKPIRDKGLLEETVRKFRAKYGADEIKKYYSKLDAAVELSI
ncbi:MAG: nitroreductase/quinone reductase family protein [Nitrososphaerales archaeon]